jgi:Tfp pilus assembly protein PilE
LIAVDCWLICGVMVSVLALIAVDCWFICGVMVSVLTLIAVDCWVNNLLQSRRVH